VLNTYLSKFMRWLKLDSPLKAPVAAWLCQTKIAWGEIS
jgi:hypothetical protein